MITVKRYDHKKINFTKPHCEQHEFYSCAVKFRHTDYWSAYQHFRSLRVALPAAKPQIYPCDYCDGLHVSSGKNYKDYNRLKKTLDNLERKMSTPGYSTKAPEEVRTRQAKLGLDLRARIAELESEYQIRQAKRAKAS